MTMETTGEVGIRVPLLSFSPPQVSGHDLGRMRPIYCRLYALARPAEASQ